MDKRRGDKRKSVRPGIPEPDVYVVCPDYVARFEHDRHRPFPNDSRVVCPGWRDPLTVRGGSQTAHGPHKTVGAAPHPESVGSQPPPAVSSEDADGQQ